MRKQHHTHIWKILKSHIGDNGIDKAVAEIVEE